MSTKSNSDQIYEILRYNKVNLSDTEAVVAIQFLIDSEVSKAVIEELEDIKSDTSHAYFLDKNLKVQTFANAIIWNINERIKELEKK